MLKSTFLMGGVLLLSGCAAGLGESFSCTEVGGVSGCTTMDEVRRNTNLYVNAYSGTSAKSAGMVQAVPSSFMTLPRRNRFGEPARTKDVVRKVTIFPFVDKHGYYVDTTDIYLILDDSRWSGRPPKAIWRD